MTCLWCEEPILPGEPYEIRGCVGEDGSAVRKIHRECAIRSVLGSLGHLRGKCRCYGGTEEDPPGLTKREAARAAARWTLGMRDLGHD